MTNPVPAPGPVPVAPGAVPAAPAAPGAPVPAPGAVDPAAAPVAEPADPNVIDDQVLLGMQMGARYSVVKGHADMETGAGDTSKKTPVPDPAATAAPAPAAPAAPAVAAPAAATLPSTTG